VSTILFIGIPVTGNSGASEQACGCGNRNQFISLGHDFFSSLKRPEDALSLSSDRTNVRVH
jgi:hypothetical protein